MADAKPFDSHVTDQRFQLLINSVTDYAIYMIEPSGRIATWNAGARRFKGYEADEIIGRNFSEFFSEEDRAAGLPMRSLATAEAEGKFETEGWRIRKDGTRFWAHVIIDPVRDDSGSLLGFAKITRDISERRSAEIALAESEQRFRMLVQGVRDYALYMLDPDGRVSNWNSGAQKIKGYSAEEIVGKHFSNFYTPEDRAAGEPARALQTALTEGKYEREAWRIRKDGTRFWAHILIDPIRDDDGHLVGFAKVTRDITERRRAQEELEEARLALFQSQKMQALGELTGGIAHDFNNMLTIIIGSLDMAKRKLDSDRPRTEKCIDNALEGAQRASQLTGRLLAFSRQQPLAPKVVDL
ncbi:MAG: sensor histidine kinase, partial [Alphaproteobacteria bacterium]|nr:sensor histidine kinase [Alphaproteobacteria bacterium]